MLRDRWWLVYLRSGASSGNLSEHLRFGKVLCGVVSSLVTFPQNVTPNSLDLHSILGQEAWSCGSDHCHTRCCWHSSFLICIPLLSCLKLVATFFRMHVSDPLMMHCGMGSVRSTLRCGGMALALRRCVTGLSSNRPGVAFLVTFTARR